ncbi:hypothetical protein YC2023_016874 [Brassica napus]
MVGDDKYKENHKDEWILAMYLVGLGRIGYQSNFKVSGSGSLSGGSIILLSLSGSGVLGYPGVGYPPKNCNIRRISGSGFGSLK